MNYYKNNIRTIKGDTFTNAIVIEGLGQVPESIYFTCRDSLNDDSNILFEKSLNNGITQVSYDEAKDIRTYIVRLAPNDTRNLQAGTYYYDEQIAVNGDVITIMKGRLILEQDVTRKTATPFDPEQYLKIILDEVNGEVIGITLIDKSTYLIETKELIKNALNQFFDAGMTSADTFRSVATTINEIYEDYPQSE